MSGERPLDHRHPAVAHGPLIVTAELASANFAWLDALRRRHYPPERNQSPAHLTMFHALPPSAEAEIGRELAQQAKAPIPRATLAGLMNLGTGVALRIVSDDLETIRDDLADHGTGCSAHRTAPAGGRTSLSKTR